MATHRKPEPESWLARAIVDLFRGIVALRRPVRHFGPVLADARKLWAEFPAPTRVSVVWAASTGVAGAALVLASGAPGRWWICPVVLGIAAIYITLVVDGARESYIGLRNLAAALDRHPVGAPALARWVSHCGCVHEYAWHEVDQVWLEVKITQSPDCTQVVTV